MAYNETQPGGSKIKIETSPITGVLQTPPYVPTDDEQHAYNRVLNDFILGRLVSNRQYNYFNGLSLYDCIDDWTTRWNGYVSAYGPLAETNSNIFLNFTRNLIIEYLAKAAASPTEPKIKAINRKNFINNQKLADLLKDLNEFSLNNENGSAKFMQVALETTVKGTAIVYEGYRRTTQIRQTPISWDAEKGKFKFKKVNHVDFDDCYQELCRLEDIYILNPFEPDIQKQPCVIWKKVTTYYEAWLNYGKYDNWKYVQPGAFRLLAEAPTFYGQEMYTELQPNQVQMLYYYNRKENRHIIMANNVILYNGPSPFLHGKYPFAKYIFEPFGNDFFWGAGAPFKFMGEQDTENSFVNMMVDKTYGSLLPYGLSSDLDDLIEDDTLAVNKIRKVGDISKWKFDTLPGVSAGEQGMFQTFMNMIRENSGLGGAADQFSPKGGKLNVRQVLLKQQEQAQKLNFSLSFLEDGERDRTELRLKNIMQFYSIPKIEKITGADGKTYQDLFYRTVTLNDTKLSDGKTGTKIIKLVDEDALEDNKRKQLEDELSVLEEMGDMNGTPTEAIAIPVSMFDNDSYDLQVQVVKSSSYQKMQALEQAERQDYAQWRLAMAPYAPLDALELVKYVDEAYDIDTERFTSKAQQQPQMNPAMAGMGGPVPEGKPVLQPQANSAMEQEI